jgi:hypothetical protein
MLWTIAALVVLVMAVAGIFVIRNLKNHTIPVMRSIPERTFLLVQPLEMKNLPDFLEKNKELAVKLQKLPFTAELMAAILRLDSLMQGHDRMLDIILHNKILVGLTQTGIDSVGLIILAQLDDPLSARHIHSFLTGNYDVTNNIELYGGSAIHRIEGDQKFFYNLANGIFCGSNSLKLVESSLDQRQSNSETFSEAEFKEIMNTSGKNVDANVYIKLIPFNDMLGYRSKQSQVGEFAALDLLVKEDVLLLNGFISSRDSKINLYNIFSGNEPTDSRCPSILPEQTLEFYKIGFDNFDSLCCSPSKLKLLNEELQGKPISNELKKRFINWTGREVTVARTGEGYLASFAVKEGSSPLQDLDALLDKNYSREFFGTQFHKLEGDGLMRDLLWPYSHGIDMPYMGLIGGFMVFCSSEHIMQQVIKGHALGRTLIKSNKYKFFSRNITDQSQLYHYLDLEPVVRSNVDSFSDLIIRKIAGNDEDRTPLPVYNGQFSAAGEWFYTNLSFTFLSDVPEQASYLWSIAPDNQHVTGTWNVDLPGKDGHVLLASTASGRVYLIDENGNINGSTRINGEIMGEIASMNATNGIYLVFNTADQLHKIDLTGQEAEGFPMDLEAAAVAGLTLVKYPDQKDYRVLVPGIDNKIYNFDESGKQVKGWKYPELPSTPAGSAIYLESDKKDYLIFTDAEGNILVTDRRGKERVKVKEHVNRAAHSGLYINRTNSKGLFITTDQQGHLTYISSKGNIKKTVFGNFTNEHYFLYSDINGDGNRDFVYFDLKQLQVFDRFKKHLINIKLPERPASMPLIIEGESKRKSFFYRGASGTIYQIDHKGRLQHTEQLVTGSRFSAWRNNQNGMVFVMISGENNIFLYPF